LFPKGNNITNGFLNYGLVLAIEM